MITATKISFPDKELAKIDKDAAKLNIKNRSRFIRAVLSCRDQVTGSTEFWKAFSKNAGMQAKKKK